MSIAAVYAETAMISSRFPSTTRHFDRTALGTEEIIPNHFSFLAEVISSVSISGKLKNCSTVEVAGSIPTAVKQVFQHSE